MKYASVRYCLALLLVIASRAFAEPQEFSGSIPIQWSTRMADAQMARSGENLRGKWDYANNVFLLSLLNLGEQTSDPRYAKYSVDTIGSFITSNGQIRGYRADDYTLDNVNPGKTLLRVWQLTKDDRFQKSAALLRKQFETHPRTADGGFWHKKIYPHQMWLDGIYMGGPFLAEYGKLFNEPADFDEVARQIRLADEHMYDAKTGLFYHGWDESKEQSWANKTTGTSPSFWSRAIGWYAMALVDTLDYFPADHPKRTEIIATLNKLAAGVVKHQDAGSGLWYQVIDQGKRTGNYLEASGSSMFVYSLAKAINKGYIARDTYQPAVIKGFAGLTGKLIKLGDNGAPTLTQCCPVAGLSKDRDGSFEYYLRDKAVDNDVKAVGPFIMAGIEVQRMLLVKPLTLQASQPNDWAKATEILARIKAPTFPDRKFNITSYGAVAGIANDSSAAIIKAIDACNAAGGGHVIVPAGEFLTGPVTLKSNVDLHLEEGATLKWKTDPAAYPIVFTRFESSECYNFQPFIYALDQENIAVTGTGTIDGQADQSNWWALMRNGRGGRQKIVNFNMSNTPVEQRQFTVADGLRPNFFQPIRCRNVMIDGLHVRNSPMWEINPTLCTNVIVRNLDIVSHGPNNDGCDPDSCRDVLIENCIFDTGDDCIAIKSGRNNDGRRVNVPSENIIIRNCTMKDGHGGVTIGSEISGSCRNVFVENCNMDSANLDRVLRLKSNAVRGGTIENIFMRNINVGRVADAVLQIDFVYEEGANGPYKPAARNINMENISVRETPRVLNVVGFAGSDISGVQIRNSTFLQVAKPDVVREAQDVKLIDCKVEMKPQPTTTGR